MRPTPFMARPVSPELPPIVPQDAPNLLRNGDFALGPPPGKEALPGASSDWGDTGAPAGWNYWQEELSKGRFDWNSAKKAARASGVRSGCFLQTVAVKPGERYLLEASVETRGVGLATLSVGFKTPEGKWLPATARQDSIQPIRKEGTTESFSLAFVVPKTAGIAVIQLNAHGQPSETDVLLWKSAGVRRVR